MPTALSCLQQTDQAETDQSHQAQQHVAGAHLSPQQDSGAGARPSPATACSLWGMGAGKVVTLIKKCLHRDRTCTPPVTEEAGSGSGSSCSSTSGRMHEKTCGSKSPHHHHHHRDPRYHHAKDKQCDIVAEAVGGGGCAGCHHHHHHQSHCSQHLQPHQGSSSVPPGRSPNSTPFLDYPVRSASPNNHVMYSAGQLDARAQREVDRQREHQIRVQSVNKDFRLNLPPFIPLTRDGEEGYTQSQRQLTSSQRYKGSISICPPPNMTICPPSDSGPPFHSQSDMVLNKHGTGLSGKAAHRTEPPMSAPPATTDNNNRKSNLNFNYSPVSVGGSSEQASRPPSHSQHASLSLGMYGAVHGHSGWSAEECPAGTTTSAGQPPPANANVNANGRRSPCSPGADTTTSSMIAPPPPYTQQNHSNNM